MLEEGFEWVLAATEAEDEDRRYFLAAFNATTGETVDWHWVEDRVSEYTSNVACKSLMGIAVAVASGRDKARPLRHWT